MPIPTARYRFEYRLLKWATDLSNQLCGEERGFFVGFREDGSVRRVYFAPPHAEMAADRKTALAKAYGAWFLFNPYPGDPGVFYVEWLGLDATWVRPWLGAAPQAADLEDVRDGKALERWPSAWRVIVRG